MGVPDVNIYIKRYQLHGSADDAQWYLIAPSDNEDTWTGNIDDSSIVSHELPGTIICQYIRLTSIEYNQENANSKPALSWRVFGCETTEGKTISLVFV